MTTWGRVRAATSKAVGLFEFDSSAISSQLPSSATITGAILSFSHVGNFGSFPKDWVDSTANIIGLATPADGFHDSDFASPGQTLGSFHTTQADRTASMSSFVYPVDVTKFVQQSLAKDPSDHQIAFRLEAPGGNVIMNDTSGQTTQLTITYGDAPDVFLDSVKLDGPTGNIVADYTVTGAPITAQTTVNLYWAGGAGASLDDRILTNPDGSPLPAPASVPLDGLLGTHTATFTPAMLTAMGSAPVGATTLMAVADPPVPATTNPPSPGMPNGLINDPTEGDNFKSMPIPDTTVDLAVSELQWTPDDSAVKFNYSVTGNMEGKTTTSQFYLSDKDTFDPNDPNQVMTSVSEPVQQTHYGDFTIPVPDLNKSISTSKTTNFILVVIDTLVGAGVAEASVANNTAAIPATVACLLTTDQLRSIMPGLTRPMLRGTYSL